MVEDIVEINIQNVSKLLCDASLDPLIICNEDSIINCTNSAIILLGYENTSQFFSITLKEMLSRHFTPKFINVGDEIRDASLFDIVFCHVFDPATKSKKVVTVKVKEWFLNSHRYFSVGIKDVSAFSSATYAAEIAPTHELSRKQKLMEEFEWLADSLPCLIWVLTAGGDAEYTNKRVLETLGLVAGGNWEACMHPDDWKRFAPKFQNAIKSPSVYTVELRYRHISYSLKENPLEINEVDDSQYRWYLINSVPVFDKKDGKILRWVTTATDIHDHKLAEEEKQNLILAQKAAQSVARMKSEFIAMMSHEIRTPLFGIVGNTCMLMETAVTADQVSLLDHTNESAKNLMSVIEDILDFQRVEAGKLTIESIPFSIKDIIGELSNIYIPKAEGKGLEFEISPVDLIPATLGDPNRVSQLLNYLLSNAIKFTHQGSVKLFIKTEDMNDDKLLIEFTIKDTGIGISNEILPNIFSPWTQADTSKRRAFGGTGLGLAITKSLVDLMQGTINVISEVNKGTIISVRIPFYKHKLNTLESKPQLSLNKLIRHQTLRSNMRLCLTNPTNSPYPTSCKSPPTSKSLSSSKKVKSGVKRKSLLNNDKSLNNITSNSSNTFKILIAEDNQVNQAILKRYLQKMGDIDVTMVGDGQAAVDVYFSNPQGFFHVILLDQSMPKMDGDAVCQEIRKVDSEQIIISVSANVLLADQAHFLAIGMNDHISKPVIFANFQNVLRKWLSVAQNMKQNKRHEISIENADGSIDSPPDTNSKHNP